MLKCNSWSLYCLMEAIIDSTNVPQRRVEYEAYHTAPKDLAEVFRVREFQDQMELHWMSHSLNTWLTWKSTPCLILCVLTFKQLGCNWREAMEEPHPLVQNASVWKVFLQICQTVEPWCNHLDALKDSKSQNSFIRKVCQFDFGVEDISMDNMWTTPPKSCIYMSAACSEFNNRPMMLGKRFGGNDAMRA